MGTWGSGVFDSDAAGDFVADIAREVARELHPPEEIEDIDIILAAVAMTTALVTHCGAPRPDRGEIVRLRAGVLKVYDDQVDGLEATLKFRTERRKVIERTFDELLAAL